MTSQDVTPNLSPLKLTEWTSCGGCAAKWGADLLKDLVGELAVGAQPKIDPALLVGLAPFDDAAVYQVTDEVAIVSTTDFFHRLWMTPKTLVRFLRLTHAAMYLQWVVEL